jgi:hypothetical protein
MYTFSAEIDLIILLLIMFVGCIIIQSITNHYLWSQGDCDAHYHAYCEHQEWGDSLAKCRNLFLHDIYKVPEPKETFESIKCRCFKCGNWYGKEYFTMQTWEMVSPEDAVCLSCVEPVEHIVKYYEHLYNLED